MQPVAGLGAIFENSKDLEPPKDACSNILCLKIGLEISEERALLCDFQYGQMYHKRNYLDMG